MRIIEIVTQNRDEFWALMECEHCRQTMLGEGHDIPYWHNRELPALKCPQCGKSRDDLQGVMA